MRQAKITTCHPTEQALRLIWMASICMLVCASKPATIWGVRDWSGTALVLHFVSIGFADFPAGAWLTASSTWLEAEPSSVS
jgi:hypothetical protein